MRAAPEVERRPTGKADLQLVRDALAAARAATRANAGRARPEHVADRRVELAERGEPGREPDLRHGHLRRLQKQPRDVRTLGPGQRKRSGAQVGQQDSPELAFAVAEPAREPRHAVALDDPVRDQAHRPASDVTADIPVRRPGDGTRDAALAGAEAGCLGRRRGRIEPDVLAPRRACRAAGAAVDAGRRDAQEEVPVETGIAAGYGAVAVLEVTGNGHEREDGISGTPALAGFGHRGAALPRERRRKRPREQARG